MVLEEIIGIAGTVAGDKRKLTTTLKVTQGIFFYYSLILLVILLLPRWGGVVLKIVTVAAIIGIYCLFYRWLKEKSGGDIEEKWKLISKTLKETIIKATEKPTTDFNEIKKEFEKELSKILMKIPFSVWVMDILKEFERLLLPAVGLYLIFYRLLSVLQVGIFEYIKPTTINLWIGFLGYLATTAVISLLSLNIRRAEEILQKKDRPKLYIKGIFSVLYFLIPFFLVDNMFKGLTGEIKPQTAEYILGYKACIGKKNYPKNPVERESLKFLEFLTGNYEVYPIIEPEKQDHKQIKDHEVMISNIDYMFNSITPTEIGKLKNTYLVMDKDEEKVLTGKVSIIQIILEHAPEEIVRQFSMKSTPLFETKHRYFLHIYELYVKGSIVSEVIREVTREISFEGSEKQAH